MNKRLTHFTGAFEVLLGSLAFAALYSSPLSLAIKLLVGALVLLIAEYFERQAAHQTLYFDSAAALNMVAFLALEARLLDRDAPSLSQALESHAKSERFRDIASGQGISYGIVLCIKFTIWLGGGALLALYVLPDVLRKWQ